MMDRAITLPTRIIIAGRNSAISTTAMQDTIRGFETRRCPVCLGSGGDEHEKDFGGRHPVTRWERCANCGGTGLVDQQTEAA